jgi:hypothetical protein
MSVVSSFGTLQPNFAAPPPAWPVWGTGATGGAFILIGARFTTTSPDFILGEFRIGYVPAAYFF